MRKTFQRAILSAKGKLETLMPKKFKSVKEFGEYVIASSDGKGNEISINDENKCSTVESSIPGCCSTSIDTQVSIVAVEPISVPNAGLGTVEPASDASPVLNTSVSIGMLESTPDASAGINTPVSITSVESPPDASIRS